MTTSSNMNMKLSLEWIYRGLVIAILTVGLWGLKAKVKEIINEEVIPIIAKQDKFNESMSKRVDTLGEKVDKIGTQIEVLTAVDKERQRKSGVFIPPFNHSGLVTTNNLGY